jgi:hypothetical protein
LRETLNLTTNPDEEIKMKSMKEYKVEAAKGMGVDPNILTESSPTKDYIWYAYGGGMARAFKTEKEAKEFSKNIEKVETKESKQRYEDFWNIRSKVESIASDAFHADLRKEYSYLSDEIYNACYSQAYNRGHAYGYDEVASIIDDVVEFAEELIEITSKGNLK